MKAVHRIPAVTVTVVPSSKKPLVRIPRLWPGSTIVCLGSGPSLTQADVDWVRGRAKVIAVNDAYRLAPWADALWACDEKWWKWHKGVPSFHGLKYTLKSGATQFPGVQLIRHTGSTGLELVPTGVRHGHNSGYQAINAAMHFGAARIILLGYDMGGRTHFFGRHPDNTVPPFLKCLKAFQTLVQPLKAAGVEVINCTPTTALRCFPLKPLRDIFPAESIAC